MGDLYGAGQIFDVFSREGISLNWYAVRVTDSGIVLGWAAPQSASTDSATNLLVSELKCNKIHVRPLNP